MFYGYEAFPALQFLIVFTISSKNVNGGFGDKIQDDKYFFYRKINSTYF